jgi:hypothetical protein
MRLQRRSLEIHLIDRGNKGKKKSKIVNERNKKIVEFEGK